MLAFLISGAASLFAQPGWTPAADMPTARSGICSIVFNGKIYVLGGRDNSGQILKSVEVYDPVENKWETNIPQLSKERENGAAVVFLGIPFVIGGRDKNGQPMKKVEFLGKKKEDGGEQDGEDEWRDFSELREKRAGLAAVVLEDKLYAIGGLTVRGQAEQFLDTVEFYESSEDGWLIADNWQLDFASASFSTVVLNDSAFTIGGFSTLGPLGFVQRYHPVAGISGRQSLLTPRGGAAAATVADRIFIMGGFGQGNQVLRTVEYFEPSSNRWRRGRVLKTAREDFAAVAVGDKIYLIGGRDSSGQAISSVEVAEATEIVTSVVSPNPAVPFDFDLEQNYPNPFNPETKLIYRVSAGLSNAKVRLLVYNLRGMLVKTLVDSKLSPGRYEVIWDGTDDNGSAVASGIYLYALTQGDFVTAKKMTLIR